MQTGITIIICCYNSSLRLSKTLNYLSMQEAPLELQWEILLVDNNSSDDTASIAEVEWKKYGLLVPLRVIYENIPGLSAARESGIREAAYDYLVFCDDDNWLAPNYVANAFRLLKDNPTVAAIGGFNVGVYETIPPSWMNFFEPSYAIGKQGSQDFEILEGHRYLVGAGMAFKRDSYYHIKQKGFKFYLTDRIGNKVVGGGDVELCFIFKLAGYSIAYTSELVLQHYMPVGRITQEYLVNMWHQYSHSWLVFEAYKVLLDKRKGIEVISNRYWKKIAIQRLLEMVKKFPTYTYQRIKGNIVYSLPYETNILYNIYLRRNTKQLINMVQELQSIVKYD